MVLSTRIQKKYTPLHVRSAQNFVHVRRSYRKKRPGRASGGSQRRTRSRSMFTALSAAWARGPSPGPCCHRPGTAPPGPHPGQPAGRSPAPGISRLLQLVRRMGDGGLHLAAQGVVLQLDPAQPLLHSRRSSRACPSASFSTFCARQWASSSTPGGPLLDGRVGCRPGSSSATRRRRLSRSRRSSSSSRLWASSRSRLASSTAFTCSSCWLRLSRSRLRMVTRSSWSDS